MLLRYFNPVGAHPSGHIGEDPTGPPSNLMPLLAKVCTGKMQSVKIFGQAFDTPDGTAIRDYIHVTDIARAHVAALKRIENESPIGCEVYNLSSGKGCSVREIIYTFEKVTGKKILTELCDPRPGEVGKVFGDNSLAYQKLGWKCEFGIEEICRDLWNFIAKNPNGYHKV